MSFIKSISLKIMTGFLYGIGFIFSIFIIGSFYFSTYPEGIISTKSERNEEYEIKTTKIERNVTFREYDKSANLVAEITKERISENEFTLLGVLKNEGIYSWSAINVKAELFNKDGEFIDECSEYISETSSPGKVINFKLSCGSCSKIQFEQYHSYKLSITGAHFKMQ